MTGIAWGRSDAFLDEHPDAYKDIDVVISDAADLVDVRHTLRQVVNVNPAYTSQDCSGCGTRVPKTLQERWHTCPNPACQLSLHRDINAAINILHRALEISVGLYRVAA